MKRIQICEEFGVVGLIATLFVFCWTSEVNDWISYAN